MDTKTQYPREFLLQLQNDPLSKVWPENLPKEYMRGMGRQIGKDERKVTNLDHGKKPYGAGNKENTGCTANCNVQLNLGSPRAGHLGENKERRMGANKLNNKLNPGSPRGGRMGEATTGSGVKRGRIKKSPAMLARDAKRREAFLASKKLQENATTQHGEEMLQDEYANDKERMEVDHSSFADVKIIVTDMSEDCGEKVKDVDINAVKKTDLEILDAIEDCIRIPEDQETACCNYVEKQEGINMLEADWYEVVIRENQKKRRDSEMSESGGRRERRISEGEKVGLWLYQRLAYFPLQVWRKISRTIGKLTSRARIQDIYIPKEWL